MRARVSARVRFVQCFALTSMQQSVVARPLMSAPCLHADLVRRAKSISGRRAHARPAARRAGNGDEPTATGHGVRRRRAPELEPASRIGPASAERCACTAGSPPTPPHVSRGESCYIAACSWQCRSSPHMTHLLPGRRSRLGHRNRHILTKRPKIATRFASPCSGELTPSPPTQKHPHQKINPNRPYPLPGTYALRTPTCPDQPNLRNLTLPSLAPDAGASVLHAGNRGAAVRALPR